MTERTTQEEKWRPLAFRTALQRLTGLALLLIGLGGLWYWWEHPLPGGAAIRQTVLAGQAFCLPVGLWQILYCPRRRGPGEGELAVYNADWIAPISAAMELFVAVVLPMVPVLVATDSDLAALIVCDVFLMVGILAMAVVVMAARNEGLLVGPDGRVECWTIWGRHHWVEERPALLRVRPRLGRYYVCDEEGHVLYHFDRDMVNDTALLNLLQARGVANTSAGVRQKMTNPWPKVREVLDWDEADWTPAHRYLNWMRMVVWLPPAALLVQWWMLQEGLPLLAASGLFWGVPGLAADLCLGALPHPAEQPLPRAASGHPGLAADACEAVADPAASGRCPVVGDAGSPGVPCGPPGAAGRALPGAGGAAGGAL